MINQKEIKMSEKFKNTMAWVNREFEELKTNEAFSKFTDKELYNKAMVAFENMIEDIEDEEYEKKKGYHERYNNY